MAMKQEILKLSSLNSLQKSAAVIGEKLKPEIFGNSGGIVISDFRENFEPKRLKNIGSLKTRFLKTANISNMDKKINDLTLGILRENEKVNNLITYDFLMFVHDNSSSFKKICPQCIEISEFILDKKNSDVVIKTRIISIVTALVYKSVAQSARSNAGVAGESVVSLMFDAIGLKEDKHYKREHKSNSGSDTDFVLPYVEDYQDQNIDACCAVQFSSNDRLRMVEGELKSGKKYAITGNGLDASSKNCDAIGYEILMKAKQENHLLVCYSKEKERMIKKLTQASQKKKKNGELYITAHKSIAKSDFFQNNCLSFSEFAKAINTMFAGR
ncbi:type II restriction endonuclease [Gammaproteobacteria bacterium]|nr:type II restriction endonuclease [Gammaproteobacteria bacterium]